MTLLLVLAEDELLRRVLARELAPRWGVVTAATPEEAKRLLAGMTTPGHAVLGAGRAVLGASGADVGADRQLAFLRDVQTCAAPLARLLLVGPPPWDGWVAAPTVVDAFLPKPWPPGALVALVEDALRAVRLARGTEPPPRP